MNECDVVVIGGGVIGAAVLWELAKYDLRLALIEARNDVADGTSKANSGIAHTGFDADPRHRDAVLLGGTADAARDDAGQIGGTGGPVLRRVVDA